MMTSDSYARNDTNAYHHVTGGGTRVAIAMRSLGVSMAELSQESWLLAPRSKHDAL